MDIRKVVFMSLFGLTLYGGSMDLTSISFKNNDTLADKFTCNGKSISPALSWKGMPSETESFVLVFNDPDAVGGVWDHWVIYDIPSDIDSISENGSIKGAKLGVATNGKKAYVAPCPPKGSGLHHYTFTIYALDVENIMPKDLKKSSIKDAMNSHILAESTLVGTYEKKKKFFFF